MRTVDVCAAPSGPGRYFADHPAVYRISVVGSGGVALYAASRAVRAAGARRASWMALALLETAITAGMMQARQTRPEGPSSTRRSPTRPCSSEPNLAEGYGDA
jgi:hypothetical protein